ncbi:MAG: polysaccharide biosynthesis tyrosine autokinase [Acidimicrobiales bacterium]
MSESWNGGSGELELRDYLSVLWRRKKVVVLATLLLVSTALGLSYAQSPVYRATAEFVPPPTSALVPGVDTGKGSSDISTAVEFLTKSVVRDKVTEAVGSGIPKAIAEQAGAGFVAVSVESGDPAQAAAVADAYVRAYLDIRRAQAVDGLRKAIAEIEPRYNEALAKVNEINGRLAAATFPPTRQALELQLGPELTRNEAQVRVDGPTLLDLNTELARAGNDTTTVVPAKEPQSPIRPTPVRNGILAFPIGLVIGVALAFVFEHLDDSLKSKEDVQRVSGGLPVVGVIPQVRMRDDSGSELVSLAAPDSPVVEAYRSLRTSVQFLALDGALGSIQVTSSNAAEGKTTTMANLAVVMARAGSKVVVIDCDLRRPRVHEIFGVPNDVGFTSVFQGHVPLSAALASIPGERNLRVLPSGPLPPNPSELLASRRTASILASLKAQGVVVLLDCPPVMPVTDAAALAAWVDTTLLVAAQGTTTKKQLQRSVEVLRQVNAPLVGTVLNRAQGQEGYGYGYYYRRPEPGPARPKRANGSGATDSRPVAG